MINPTREGVGEVIDPQTEADLEIVQHKQRPPRDLFDEEPTSPYLPENTTQDPESVAPSPPKSKPGEILLSPIVPADEMADLIKRHCVLTDEEADAIVLWLTASYMINSFRIFPKLALISPEKRCGKTTTMEVIHSIAHEAVMASNISGAAIYRITEQLQPTLLIDEADTFLKNGDPGLVGLINSGHTKTGAQVIRCDGEENQVKSFSTWMPMVLASIGDLQPTIMDRSVIINLRRKKMYEHTDPIPVDMRNTHETLRDRIKTWCSTNEPLIRSSPVKPPEVGNSRAEDNWTPMFTIAKKIGGGWPERCMQAYRHLTTAAEPELPTQLLLDIRACFQQQRDKRITSVDLISELCVNPDGPWHTSNSGKKLSPHQMAKLLRPYGIKPKVLRFGEDTKRGYKHTQFTDAFDRYLS
jgi:hypothetical protein